MPEMVAGAGIGAMESAISHAAASAGAWAALDAEQRIGLLRACVEATAACADDWVVETCAMKQVEPQSDAGAHVRMAGPVPVLRHLRQYISTLQQGEERFAALHVEERAGGTAVRVFPRERYDRWMFPETRADVMLMPGEQLRPWPKRESGVAAVLGAGNITSIPILDALWQLLAENRVAVVKLHPAMAGLRSVFERAMAPLVGVGFLGFVEGGVEEGQALVRHPQVDAVHLTGSTKTARALIEHGLPSDRPFTAELGAVTPVLVVPGPWGRADLRQHARSLAGMLALNGGFNCLTPKLLITARDWPQRADFLDEMRSAIRDLPASARWFPNAEAERQAFAAATGSGAEADWLFVTGVPPDPGHPAFTREHFGGMLAETALPVEDPEEFLAAAVRFVNAEVEGTLSCMILAPPHTRRATLDLAVDALQYGTVAINTWSVLGYSLASTPWQGFPGATLEDPQSGFGTVHHTLLFADPVKTIIRAPFRPGMKPIWLPGRRRLQALGRALQEYERSPRFGSFMRVALAALLG